MTGDDIVTCGGLVCEPGQAAGQIDAVSVVRFVDEVLAITGWLVPMVGIALGLFALYVGVHIGNILGGGNAS